MSGKKIFPVWLLLAPFVLFAVEVEDNEKEKDRDVLKYGTDAEIAGLVGKLKAGGETYLDGELAAFAGSAKDPALKSAVFDLFGGREKGGAEEAAIDLIRNRNGNREPVDSVYVISAIDYLGKTRYTGALDTLRKLLETDDALYNGAAIKAMARVTPPEETGNTTAYLIDYYNSKKSGDDIQRTIINATGELKTPQAVPFLTGIIGQNAGAPLTMAALNALGLIQDESTLAAIRNCLDSKDPNIRAAAVSALGGFRGAEAEEAIISGFRDDYYRTRIAAMEAAGARKLSAAVPALKYRAENDREQVVKSAAIRALGAVGGSEAERALEELLNSRNTADASRLLAAGGLIKLNPDKYAELIAGKYEDAKKENQKALVPGYITVLSKAKTGKIKDFTERLFNSKDAPELVLALELCSLNSFCGFNAQIERLAQGNSSIAGRARKLTGTGEQGFPANTAD